MEEPKPVRIPFELLSQEAQLGILDEFIFREGTDYGWQEASLEKKRADIMRQIERREIELVFDPSDESTTLRLSAKESD